MEVWREVVGFGFYQVSNFGRVRSKPRVYYRSNGKPHTVIGKILAQNKRGYSGRINKKYYKSVFLIIKPGVKGKHYPVHRLVAEAFLENPNNKDQINHIDSNPINNHIENLEWCNNSENQTHSVLAGRRNHLQKKVAIKNMDGEILMYVGSIKVASMITGANRTGIKCVHKGINTHAKGFKFEILTNQDHRVGINTIGRTVNNKMVVQLSMSGEPLRVFESFKDAAKHVGGSRSAFHPLQTGRLKTFKGYRWYFPNLQKVI